jgi:EAL domain-containing protein (putative c-di-GMP-specific phosphodiesterase class I)
MTNSQRIFSGEILDFQARVFKRELPDNILWSALNLLEAQLCYLDNNGTLSWNRHESRIFNDKTLPKSLDELGEQFAIKDFTKLFQNTKIENNIKIFALHEAGLILRHDLKTGLLALQKISPIISYDFENDQEARDLKSALDDGRIILYKQPIVCAITKEIMRYECLARMEKIDGKIALPYEFIPAAERSGLICDLDIRALEIALDMIAKNCELALSTNISFATICNAQARKRIYDALEMAQLAKNSLTIEITETIAIHDFEIANEFGNNIKKHGARLSLDDFGSGHTSFKSLRELPFDEVKIDGQYIKDLDARPDAFIFVRALCNLIHDLNLECVAERVENQKEANILSQLPIQYLQGYLFGKPNP